MPGRGAGRCRLVAALAGVVLVVAALVVATQIGGADGEAELLRNVDAHRGPPDLQHPAGDRRRPAGGAALLPLQRRQGAQRRHARPARRHRRRRSAFPRCWPRSSAGSRPCRPRATSSPQVRSCSTKGGAGQRPRQRDRLRRDRRRLAASPRRWLRPRRANGLPSRDGLHALYAMRTGLLTRFWGSLGMALGAVSFLFFQFTLLWFVYFGLLAGRPGARRSPPAWQQGEAEPWPTPGRKPRGPGELRPGTAEGARGREGASPGRGGASCAFFLRQPSRTARPTSQKVKRTPRPRSPYWDWPAPPACAASGSR